MTSRHLRQGLHLALLLMSCTAQAGMTGASVKAWTHVPASPFFGPGGDFAAQTFTVSDGVEANFFGVLNEGRLDVSDDRIVIDFWRPSGRTLFELGSYEFSFLSPGVNITAVSLGSGTTLFEDLAGTPISFDGSRISYTHNAISIDLGRLAAPGTSRIELLVTTTAPVPEPGQAALLAFGLGALAAHRLQQRRAQARRAGQAPRQQAVVATA